MKLHGGGILVGALAMLGLFWVLRLVGLIDTGASDRARAAQLERALHAQRESTVAYQHRAAARDSELVQLRADSAERAGELAVAHDAAQIGLTTIRALLAQLPDSSRDRGDTAIALVVHEGEACRAALTNCEQRTQVEHIRADDAERQMRAAVALLDTTRTQWHDAERRARPNLVRDLWRTKDVLGPLLLLLVLTNIHK